MKGKDHKIKSTIASISLPGHSGVTTQEQTLILPNRHSEAASDSPLSRSKPAVKTSSCTTAMSREYATASSNSKQWLQKKSNLFHYLRILKMKRKLMLTHTQLQFFVLLRSGLWDKPVDVNELQNPEAYQETGSKKNTGNAPNTDVDWKTIYKIAREQTVVGLIADAIGTLPADQRPPIQILQRFIMDKLAIEKIHAQLNETLNEIVKALNTHNIPHILLKGQGVAQNYPHPTSRTCGDIDLYIGLQNYEITIQFLKQYSDNPNKTLAQTSKHTSLIINGIEIEIHKFASDYGTHKKNRQFLNFTQKMLDTPMSGVESNICLERWNNSGTIINLPSPEFNVVFLLIHLLEHFINSGIGVRQICDWSCLLYKKRFKESDVISIFKDFKLEKACYGFASVAHYYLGLPSKYNPFRDYIDRRLSDKIVQIILKTGNFGHYNKAAQRTQDDRYIIFKCKRFMYHLGYFSMIFNIFPKIIFNYFTKWFYDGCKDFLKK